MRCCIFEKLVSVCPVFVQCLRFFFVVSSVRFTVSQIPAVCSVMQTGAAQLRVNRLFMPKGQDVAGHGSISVESVLENGVCALLYEN